MVVCVWVGVCDGFAWIELDCSVLGIIVLPFLVVVLVSWVWWAGDLGCC